MSTVFIDSRKQALRYLDEVAEQKCVAVDTEFQPNTNEVIIWSYSWRKGVRRVVTGELLTSVFADWIEDRRTRKVYQNYKADGFAFKEMSLDSDRSFHADTWVMSWIRNPSEMRHGLKAQCERFLSWPRQEYKERFGYVPPGKKKSITLTPRQLVEEAPPEALHTKSQEEWRRDFIEYSADDAESTAMLYRRHKKFLREVDYWSTYLKVDRQFTLTLMRCEERGILIDRPYLEDVLRKVDIKEMQSIAAFQMLSGKPDINIRSTQQVRELLIDEFGWEPREDLFTDTGEPQTSRAAFEYWEREFGYDIATVILQFKDIATLKGTFLKGILSGIDADGRLRSDFNQCGADTGRISSRKRDRIIEVTRTFKTKPDRVEKKKIKVGMNLQNIPSRPEKDPYKIRGAFVARSGYLLVVADYSGFELCMAIHWASQWTPDSKMFEAMKKYGSPSAVHAITCIEMFGKVLSWDEWRQVKKLYPDEYTYSKNCNFNLLYGGSAKMLCRIFGWDYLKDPNLLDRAQNLINNWNDLYPEMQVYQQYMIRHGYDVGWVPTIDGRRTPVREGLTSPDDATRAYWERKCMNTPCQGSAAAFMKVAMNLIELDEELNDYGAELLFQVHDEVIVEVPENHAEAAKRRVIELMKLPYRDKMAFQVDVEAGIGVTWSEAK